MNSEFSWHANKEARHTPSNAFFMNDTRARDVVVIRDRMRGGIAPNALQLYPVTVLAYLYRSFRNADGKYLDEIAVFGS